MALVTLPDPIAEGNDKATVRAKIGALLLAWQGSTETSPADATTKLNQVAADFGLPGLAHNQAGATALDRINAAINAVGGELAPMLDLDVYADFESGRYWDGRAWTPASKIADTWSGGLVETSSGWVSKASNELALGDFGLQTVPSRTNKCTNWNANPTATTNVSKSGDAASILSVVDDAADLALAGLSNICTSGKVYKLDNSAGTTNAFATPPVRRQTPMRTSLRPMCAGQDRPRSGRPVDISRCPNTMFVAPRRRPQERPKAVRLALRRAASSTSSSISLKRAHMHHHPLWWQGPLPLAPATDR